MEFIAKQMILKLTNKETDKLAKLKEQCLIVSISSNKKQPEQVQQLDKLSDGVISRLIKSGDINSELGKTTFIYFNSPNFTQKILFVGCGKLEQFNLINAKKIIQAAIKELLAKKIKTAAWDILLVKPAICHELSKQLPKMVGDVTYAFTEFKSKKIEKPALNKIVLFCEDAKTLKKVTYHLSQGHIIANAIEATKRLADMPSNICNASYLAEKGKSLASCYSNLSATCFDEKALAELKMNAYLAVGRGSANESIMTVLEYKGATNSHEKPYVLVGKGLTFDSGGISIKPAANMDEMKYDMCGAATVYGVMQAVAELKLPINVIGIMAGCENMPSSNAYRPGDILTTMSGTTVEIINTDAEGRLVLCDVLTYVERYQPEVVIDIATLTGACIVALGNHYTGILGNDDKLVKKLINASNSAGDKAWQLPIDDDFQSQIKSTCADIVNAAGSGGGTITAACFLSRFTEKYKWSHLDIAGTAWKSGANKGATGRPVAMLVEYLLSQVKRSFS